ncbi:MAG: putative toxin-antitoxin system toxin component, PIN family [Bacteroidota bacterium]|nr:putative toxin-antitoxin system toxin component, PIN family [Bacteroidota bacterium]
MKQINLFVFDTNSLISASLIQLSINARVLDAALDKGRIVISEATLVEFIEVVRREKFDKYFVTEAERLEAINKIEMNALVFAPVESIIACRDPKDDKFLELAVAANASCIVTGDKDLLILHPFRNISILTPSDFLNYCLSL